MQRPISDVEAYTLARRADQEGASLSSQCATEYLEAYTDVAKEIHGLDFDVLHSPFDAAAVYKAGKGKKHGRFMVGARYISTPTTLSEVRTSSSGSVDDVRPQRRPRSSVDKVTQLEEKVLNLEQIIQTLTSRLSNTTPQGPPPLETSNAGIVGSTAAQEDHTGDGAHVVSSEQHVVDDSIA